MKNVLYFVLIVLLMPIYGFSQTDHSKSKKENVTVLTKKTSDKYILYVINDKYYVGDTEELLFSKISSAKVKEIAHVIDKAKKMKYTANAGKFEKKIVDVFVIVTDEKVEDVIGK